MSWTHCSKLVAALAVVAVLVAAVSPAAAVSVSAENVPDDAKVGEKQSATFTLSELYTDYDQWTLRLQTELQDATWTVTRLDNKGSKIDQQTYTKQNVSVDVGGDTDEVKVRLEGTVPEVANFSYQPAQSFVFARFVQSQQGGTESVVETFETHHFTQESKEARAAIDDAAAAIESAGGADTSEAEQLKGSAVSAYNNDNFENAKTLADQSANKANSAAQSSAQTDLIIKVVGALVVLALVVGAAFWYLNSRETYDKLG